MIKFYSGKKILVTGSGGYVGSSLVSLLSSYECEIVRASSHSLSKTNSNKAKVADVLIDWSNYPAVESLVSNCDVIFHLRAQTSAYKSEDNSREDFMANVDILSQLLSAAQKCKNSPIIVMASTVTLYGLTPKNVNINEDYEKSPTTIYDIHKMVSEIMLEQYSKKGIVNGASLRLSNVYGPGVSSSTNDRGILNQIIKKAINGEEVTVFGDGEYLRDYVYVEDVARAFVHVAAEAPKKGESYNVCSGKSRTLINAIKEVKSLVCEITGKELEYKFVSEPDYLLPIEKRNFSSDITKIQDQTSWRPQIAFESGIKKMISSLI